MKRLFVIVFIMLIVTASVFEVRAADTITLEDIADTDEMTQALPEDIQSKLSELGLEDFGVSDGEDFSLESFIGLILNTAAEGGFAPASVLAAVIAVMLLHSLFSSLRNTPELGAVLGMCAGLCIVCLLVAPLISVINDAVNVIEICSGFMLAFVPVMAAVMTVSGNAVSSGSYYGMMTLCSQGVAQISSRIISPLLKIFLGLSISCCCSGNLRLNGIIRGISGFVKWILGISMTVFTAFLSVKQLFATGADTVSRRALRFGITGLVPVVGSALSEAYSAVAGSMGLIKSGLGVFVIAALFVVFLPILIRCLFWKLVLLTAKSIGEVLALRDAVYLTDAVHSVMSVLLAVLLCIMSVFIISTALVLIVGGGA